MTATEFVLRSRSAQGGKAGVTSRRDNLPGGCAHAPAIP